MPTLAIDPIDGTGVFCACYGILKFMNSTLQLAYYFLSLASCIILSKSLLLSKAYFHVKWKWYLPHRVVLKIKWNNIIEHALHSKKFWSISNCFFILFILERAPVGGGATGGKNLKHTPRWAWSPMQGLVSWPWDNNVSQNEELDVSATEPLRRP